jgi:hypothetical protein
MVKTNYIKKIEKGDNVTRFWCTLKNLDLAKGFFLKKNGPKSSHYEKKN